MANYTNEDKERNVRDVKNKTEVTESVYGVFKANELRTLKIIKWQNVKNGEGLV